MTKKRKKEREREEKIRDPGYFFLFGRVSIREGKKSLEERRGMERQVGAGKGRTQARLRDAVRADPAIDFREGGCLLSLSFSPCLDE